ncbi:hypothetical protein [Mesorhizobium sp. LCM 4577]|uniref:hypothetical protein n=2 Tax=unclassified Mesorhizobium TaxID=325217 RepID=UPI0008DA78A5|nr:hypothetical protein [Mesorhizobium sp. LCM 4577]
MDEVEAQRRTMDEVEAQRRTMPVHGLDLNAVIFLPDLEPAQIVRCRRVRRPAKRVVNRPTSRRWLRCVSWLNWREIMSSINRCCSGPAARRLACYP